MFRNLHCSGADSNAHIPAKTRQSHHQMDRTIPYPAHHDFLWFIPIFTTFRPATESTQYLMADVIRNYAAAQLSFFDCPGGDIRGLCDLFRHRTSTGSVYHTSRTYPGTTIISMYHHAHNLLLSGHMGNLCCWMGPIHPLDCIAWLNGHRMGMD